MKVNGKLYLGGYTPDSVTSEFAWVGAELIKPHVLYYITEVGEFELYDYGEICKLYAFKQTGMLDDAMSDYEPDIDIIPIMGQLIIELDDDTLDTFEDVYDLLKRKEKE